MAHPSPAAAPPPNAHIQNKSASWRGYLLVALGTAIITGIVALWLNRPRPQPIAIHPPPTAAPVPAAQATPTPGPIVVFVSGAVQQPGLYTLPPDARVGDALSAAGGFNDAANVNAVNQATRLWDGAQIHVPALSESSAENPPAGVSGATRSATVGIDVGATLINVNTATVEQLDGLPGIGPEKAQAIIDHRPFTSIDDLDRVPGIGPATIQKFRELVTAQ